MLIIPDQMSSACAGELACSMKPLKSFFPELRPFLARSGKVLPTPCTWRGWKNRAWSRMLFGQAILDPSTFVRFVASFTYSRLLCPASPTVMPDFVQETLTIALSETGADRLPIALDSYPSVSPPWSFSKTSQLGFEALESGADSTIHSSLLERNYREWVTKSLSLSLSLRRTLKHRTIESESLLWPTAVARSESGPNNRYQRGCGKAGRMLTEEAASWQTPGTDSFRSRSGDRKDEMGLDQQARHWQTPRSNEAGGWTRDHGQPGKERATLTGEADQAALWATPKASEIGPDNAKAERSNTGMALPAMASNWPSPRAEDSESIGNHPDSLDSLSAVAQNWPTPQARDYRSGETQQSYGNSRPLSEVVLDFSLLDPKTPVGVKSSKKPRGSRPRLNPAFACWLMGAPWYWTRPESTSFGAQETRLFRSNARLQLWNYFTEQESNFERGVDTSLTQRVETAPA